MPIKTSNFELMGLRDTEKAVRKWLKPLQKEGYEIEIQRLEDIHSIRAHIKHKAAGTGDVSEGAITLDIPTALTTKWGTHLLFNTASKWKYLTTPEVDATRITSGGRAQFRDPFEVMRDYIRRAYTNPMGRKESARRNLSFLMQIGDIEDLQDDEMDSEDKGFVAGSVAIVNLGQGTEYIKQIANRLTIRTGTEKNKNAAIEAFQKLVGKAYQNIHGGQKTEMEDYSIEEQKQFALAYGMVAFPSSSKTIVREREVGSLIDEILWGFDKPVKRSPITGVSGEGIRERAVPIGYDPSDKSVFIAEPSEVTGMTDEERAGYRTLNATLGGRNIVGQFDPRTLVVPGTLSSGSLTKFKSVNLAPRNRRSHIAAFGYHKGEKADLPYDSENIESLENAQINMGVMDEIRDKDGNIIGYKKTRELEGYTIAPDESAIVGTFAIAKKGETERTVYPIRMTAGKSKIYFPKGETPVFTVPRMYNPITGKGHSGIGEKPAGLMSTDEIIKKLQSESSGVIIQKGGTGSHFEESGLTIGAYYGTAASGKSHGVKVSHDPAAIPTGLHMKGIPTVQLGATRRRQVYAVTEGVKNIVPQIMMNFAALGDSERQAKFLQELAEEPEFAGTKLGESFAKYMESTKKPDIYELGEIYSTNLAVSGGKKVDREVGARLMFQKATEMLIRKSPADPARYVERYGMALLPEQWLPIKYVDEDVKELLEQRLIPGMTSVVLKKEGLDPTSQAGQARIQELTSRFAFEEVKSKKKAPRGTPRRYLFKNLAQAWYMGLFTEPVNEFLSSREATLNPETMGAATERLGGFAQAMSDVGFGIVPGTKPADEPPSTSGWRAISDVYRYQTDPTDPVYTGESLNIKDIDVGLLGELQANPEMTPKEIYERLGKQGEARILSRDDGQIFFGPRAMVEAGTTEAGEDAFREDITLLGKKYTDALASFLSGDSPRAKGSKLNWYMRHVEETIKRGKNIMKRIQGSSIPGSAIGRYGDIEAGYNIATETEELLKSSLMDIGRRVLHLKGKRLKNWYSLAQKRIEELGGIPDLQTREPTEAKPSQSTLVLKTTARLLKSKFGLEYPEGTYAKGRGGSRRLVPGDPWITDRLGQYGIKVWPSQGDKDMDLASRLLAIIPNEKTGFDVPQEVLNWVNKTGTVLSAVAQYDEQAKAVSKVGNPLLQNEVVNDLVEMATGSPVGTKGKSYGEQNIAEVEKEATALRLGKMGLGVAYNTMRAVRAGAMASGLFGASESGATAGMARQYMGYIDRPRELLDKQGGNWGPVEQALSSAFFSTTNVEGANVLKLTTRRGDQFSEIWRSTLGENQTDFGTMKVQMTSALVNMVNESDYELEAKAFMLAKSEEDVPKLLERFQKVGVKEAMLGEKGYGKSETYDPTMTPLGAALLARAAAETKGEASYGDTPRTVEGPDGKRIPLEQSARNQYIHAYGQSMSFGDFLEHPITMAVQNSLQFMKRNQGPISVAGAAELIKVAEKYKARGMQPPAWLLALAATHSLDVEGSRLAKNPIEALGIKELLSRSMPKRVTLSGSTIAGLSSVEGITSTFYSPEMHEKIRQKTRQQVVAKHYLGYSREEYNEMVSQDKTPAQRAEDKRKQDEGLAAESMLVPKRIQELGLTATSGASLQEKIFYSMPLERYAVGFEGTNVSPSRLIGTAEVYSPGTEKEVTGQWDLFGIRTDQSGEKYIHIEEFKDISQDVFFRTARKAGYTKAAAGKLNTPKERTEYWQEAGKAVGMLRAQEPTVLKQLASYQISQRAFVDPNYKPGTPEAQKLLEEYKKAMKDTGLSESELEDAFQTIQTGRIETAITASYTNPESGEKEFTSIDTTARSLQKAQNVEEGLLEGYKLTGSPDEAEAPAREAILLASRTGNIRDERLRKTARSIISPAKRGKPVDLQKTIRPAGGTGSGTGKGGRRGGGRGRGKKEPQIPGSEYLPLGKIVKGEFVPSGDAISTISSEGRNIMDILEGIGGRQSDENDVLRVAFAPNMTAKSAAKDKYEATMAALTAITAFPDVVAEGTGGLVEQVFGGVEEAEYIRQELLGPNAINRRGGGPITASTPIEELYESLDPQNPRHRAFVAKQQYAAKTLASIKNKFNTVVGDVLGTKLKDVNIPQEELELLKAINIADPNAMSSPANRLGGVLGSAMETAVVVSELGDRYRLTAEEKKAGIKKAQEEISGIPPETSGAQALRNKETLIGSTITSQLENLSKILQMGGKNAEAYAKAVAEIDKSFSAMKVVEKLKPVVEALEKISNLSGLGDVIPLTPEGEVDQKELLTRSGQMLAWAGGGEAPPWTGKPAGTKYEGGAAERDELQKARSTFLKADFADIETTQKAQAEETEGRGFGGLARKLFGGFGLMYMRSIWNLMSAGSYVGYAERQQMEEQMAPSFLALGGQLPAGPVGQAQRREAVYYAGSGGRAMAQIQADMLQNYPRMYAAGGGLVTAVSAGGMAAWLGADILGKDKLGVPRVNKIGGAGVLGSWVGAAAMIGSQALQAAGAAQDVIGTGTSLAAREIVGTKENPLLSILVSTATSAGMGGLMGGIPGAVVMGTGGLISGAMSNKEAIASLLNPEIPTEKLIIEQIARGGDARAILSEFGKNPALAPYYMMQAAKVWSVMPEFKGISETALADTGAFTLRTGAAWAGDTGQMASFGALRQAGIDTAALARGLGAIRGLTTEELTRRQGYRTEAYSYTRETRQPRMNLSPVYGMSGASPYGEYGYGISGTIPYEGYYGTGGFQTVTTQIQGQRRVAGPSMEANLEEQIRARIDEQIQRGLSGSDAATIIGKYIQNVLEEGIVGTYLSKLEKGEKWISGREGGLLGGSESLLREEGWNVAGKNIESLKTTGRYEIWKSEVTRQTALGAMGFRSRIPEPEEYTGELLTPQQQTAWLMEKQAANMATTMRQQVAIQGEAFFGNAPVGLGPGTYAENQLWSQQQNFGLGLQLSFLQTGMSATRAQTLSGNISNFMQLNPQYAETTQGYLSGNPLLSAAYYQQFPEQAAAMWGRPLSGLGGTQLNPANLALADIGRTGQLTGLPFGTTSIARPMDVYARLGMGQNMQQAMAGATQQMATAVWGAGYEQNASFDQAAITALKEGGEFGLQRLQLQRQTELTQTNIGIQGAQLALQAKYTPMFWALEDRSRNLGYRQTEWGFQQQEKSLEMQNRFWKQDFALNLQQSQMQRQWAVQDWGFQDTTRNLQWGWRQEDFQEQSRFMTGRQRRLAERQMERETVMHGLEGDQISKQRDRQKELWALEDQRFEIAKQQHSEQLKFQEESIEQQRKFFEERKAIEEEQVALQRAYWKENFALQQASYEASKKYNDDQIKYNTTLLEFNQFMATLAGQRSLINPDTTRDLAEAWEIFNKVVGNLIDEIEVVKVLFPGLGQKATGGPIFSNSPTIVGEYGPEIISPSVPMNVLPANETRVANPWNTTSINFSNNSVVQGGGQPIVLNLNLGNERLAKFVVDVISKELELV